MGSKKRKHSKSSGSSGATDTTVAAAADTSANAGIQVSVSVLETNSEGGPVLATFAGSTPPSESVFRTFIKKPIEEDSPEDTKHIVVTETERMEFVGKDFGSDGPPKGRFQYMLGIYNEVANIITFKAVPHVHFNSTVKALKTAKVLENSSHAPDEINEARDALGQAFGSKKRKAEIRNSERNKINLAKIEGSALVIGANIEARTMDMPTKEEINNEEALSRPVPKHDLNATEPHKIYDLNDVLSPEDAALLPISNIIDAKGPKDRLKYLPANSWFVSSKLDAELQKTKKDRRKLRQLVYLSYLIKFRTLKSNLLSRRSTVRKIFKDPPAALLDNLYSKYTEPVAGEVDAQGNPKYMIPQHLQDKLTCYIAVLMLATNDLVVYPELFAKDLSIQNKRATEYLRSVGCKIEPATKEEVEKIGLTGTAFRDMHKKAILVAPLQFPKTKRFRRV